MFVPIRRDPIVFRESFSDASALQKNVRKRLAGNLLAQLKFSSADQRNKLSRCDETSNLFWA